MSEETPIPALWRFNNDQVRTSRVRSSPGGVDDPDIESVTDHLGDLIRLTYLLSAVL